MCTEGFNHTQLKLSLHQSIELTKLCHRNVNQWKELLKNLGSDPLAQGLEKAEKSITEGVTILEQTLEEVNKLSSHHHDDSVQISKL